MIINLIRILTLSIFNLRENNPYKMNFVVPLLPNISIGIFVNI